MCPTHSNNGCSWLYVLQATCSKCWKSWYRTIKLIMKYWKNYTWCNQLDSQEKTNNSVGFAGLQNHTVHSQLQSEVSFPIQAIFGWVQTLSKFYFSCDSLTVFPTLTLGEMAKKAKCYFSYTYPAARLPSFFFRTDKMFTRGESSV